MLETLTQLVPPPRLPLVTSPFGETGFERTWEEAEEVLDVSFPDDHKQVVEHYGDGLWGQFGTYYPKVLQCIPKHCRDNDQLTSIRAAWCSIVR